MESSLADLFPDAFFGADLRLPNLPGVSVSIIGGGDAGNGRLDAVRFDNDEFPVRSQDATSRALRGTREDGRYPK